MKLQTFINKHRHIHPLKLRKMIQNKFKITVSNTVLDKRLKRAAKLKTA